MLSPRAAAALRRNYVELRPQLRAELPLANVAIAYALARSHSAYESAYTAAEPKRLHPAVARAIQELRNDASLQGIGDLARSCGVSPSHLSKLFARDLGVSVTEFRNRLRLQHFLDHYHAGGEKYTLLAAALDAGFGSYPQFHRVFKRIMGYSPAGHQRAVRPQ